MLAALCFLLGNKLCVINFEAHAPCVAKDDTHNQKHLTALHWMKADMRPSCRASLSWEPLRCPLSPPQHRLSESPSGPRRQGHQHYLR